mmetsp:Transcript_53734/g.126548  ORF Transcript_53734/g.126548 Transcript_53734/m.126548 type:complete len:319 (+) Transcript_53734:1473-2429(+)
MCGSHARAQIAVVMVDAGQEAGELGERHFIDATLELDDRLQRHPVLVPAPGVEFGMVGRAQVHVTVAADHLQQEPDLFLAPVMTPGIATDEVLGHFVAQPIACSRNDADMLWSEPHFLVELSEHRLLRRFTVLDAPLRELPRVRPDAFAPEHLVALVEQDDADVGAEAFTVEHNQPQISSWFDYCIGLRLRWRPRKPGDFPLFCRDLAGFSPGLRIARLCLSHVRSAHESLPVLHLHPQGSACRCRDRQPQADDARRHDQALGRRHLQLHADGASGHPQGREDHPRGDGRGRRRRMLDAGDPARRAVAGDRPLRQDGP